MSTRLAIAALIYPTVYAVLFGVGIVAVLCVPALSSRAMTLVPNVVVVSLLLAIPASSELASRLCTHCRSGMWQRASLRSD